MLISSVWAVVTGTPWELGQLPRQMYHNPEAVSYGVPPQRRRAQKPKDSTLDTISERPNRGPASPPRLDAATSTTELDRLARERDEDGAGAGAYDGTPRKVQKGQINALAKMLSALRR